MSSNNLIDDVDFLHSQSQLYVDQAETNFDKITIDGSLLLFGSSRTPVNITHIEPYMLVNANKYKAELTKNKSIDKPLYNVTVGNQTQTSITQYITTPLTISYDQSEFRSYKDFSIVLIFRDHLSFELAASDQSTSNTWNLKIDYNDEGYYELKINQLEPIKIFYVDTFESPIKTLCINVFEKYSLHSCVSVYSSRREIGTWTISDTSHTWSLRDSIKLDKCLLMSCAVFLTKLTVNDFSLFCDHQFFEHNIPIVLMNDQSVLKFTSSFLNENRSFPIMISNQNAKFTCSSSNLIFNYKLISKSIAPIGSGTFNVELEFDKPRIPLNLSINIQCILLSTKNQPIIDFARNFFAFYSKNNTLQQFDQTVYNFVSDIVGLTVPTVAPLPVSIWILFQKQNSVRIIVNNSKKIDINSFFTEANSKIEKIRFFNNLQNTFELISIDQYDYIPTNY